MKCPLCANRNIKVVEIFPVQIIKKHYLETGLNTDYLFEVINELKYIGCNRCRIKFFDPVVLGDSQYYSHLQKKERVTNVHREWFYSVLNDKIRRKPSGRSFHIVDSTQYIRINSALEKVIKMYIKFLKIVNYHKAQDGQTIIYVYEKL
ncbi:MAG: hypothetical protein LBS23_01735 [Holosporaceae bacterium]|jgi:hypothetical protein|nr:hypothetical protein [Holosporaceae bacterium]